MTNIPKRRFKGFTEEWEEKKLGEVSEIIAGGDVDKEKIKEIGSYPVIANANTHEGIVGYYDDIYRIEAPAVTVTGRGDVGIAKARFKNFTPVVRLLVIISKLDSIFLENCINIKNIYVESTGVPQLTVPQLEKYTISFPSLPEQKLIGEFFRNLDEQINEQDKKILKLKNMKKAYLHEMFPQEGEKTPKRRFKGFTQEWEEKKLGEVVDFFSGLTYSPKDVKSIGTLVLRSSNVKDGKIVLNNNVYVDSKIVNVLNVKKWDIIVVVRNGSQDLIGKHALIEKEMPDTVIGAFMTGIRSKNSKFINAMLDSQRFSREISKDMGATINQITGAMFSKMTFLLPSLPEQKLIGEFFKKLDDEISLEEEKLEKLKNLKQAYLKDMFV